MKLLWVAAVFTGPHENPWRPDRPLEVAAGLADYRRPADLLWTREWALRGAGESDLAIIDPEDWEPAVASGLVAACRASRTTARAADAELLGLLAPEDDVMLAGRLGPDLLAKALPRTAECGLDERLYDLVAMELFCGSLGMPLPPRPPLWRAAARLRADVESVRGMSEWMGRD